MDMMSILSQYFPGVQVHSQGYPVTYASLVWEGGDPLPTEQELLAVSLGAAKEAKVRELSQTCAQHILDGFVSSALGLPHKYDAEDVDQINILGALAATGPRPDYPDGSSMPYAVRPVVDGVYQPKFYTLHTHAQLKQVVVDGAAYKLACLQHFNELRNDVAAATTLQEIDAVVW